MTLDLGAVLASRAAATPGRPALLDATGALTCAELLDAVRRTAGGLRELGVGRGDRVCSDLPPGRDVVVLWGAVNALGATWVPLPPGWGPRLLERALATTQPLVAVTDERLASRFAAVPTVVTALPDGPPVEPVSLPGSADALVVHNSGTPGAGKGVRVSPRMLGAVSATAHGGFRDERLLVQVPLHVLGGLALLHGALLRGGSVALLPGLAADGFWSAVRELAIGGGALLDPVLPALAADPPDGGAPLGRAVVPPPSPDLLETVRRRGLHWWTGFNTSEVCGALVAGVAESPPGTCGRPHPAFDCRLVDDEDDPVAEGGAGQLVVRPAQPWSATAGYVGDAAATATLWRNGWLHTGHRFTRDDGGFHTWAGPSSPAVVTPAGYMYAADVEAELVEAPGVTAARAATVGSDVVAWVVGDRLDLAALHRSFSADLPPHLVPRWVVPVPELPPAGDLTELPTGAVELAAAAADPVPAAR